MRPLCVGGGRLLRIVGFRLSQPGRRFVADGAQFGRAGVPAELLAKLLRP